MSPSFYCFGGIMNIQSTWKQNQKTISENPWEGVPPMVQAWAELRGYTNAEDFRSFYDFKLKDLTNPLSLLGMAEALPRLLTALENNEKICVYADYDMDGTPGLALLLRGLSLCGFRNLTYFQPNRFDHGYGVHPEIIGDFIDEQGVTLFITVDVGITAVEAVEVARQKSVDFIITDHHQAKEVLPEALSIINPNQPGCTSGLGYLCGAGVAFYLILALRTYLKKAGRLESEFNPKSLLDCFAIATLTDMVPVIKDNRALVQHGLVELRKTQRRGLQVLMKELRIGAEPLMAQDVSIRLSPKLNALGRMNSPLNALDVFLVKDEDKAFEFVTTVLKSHEKRVEIQQKGESIIDEFLSQSTGPVFNHLFLFSEHFHKGVVGLLSTKIVQKYGVPAFVGTVQEDKIIGSARAPEGTNVLAALQACEGYLNKFGGHKQAAGFELPLDQAPALGQSFHGYFAQLGEGAGEKVLYYDFKCSLAEMDSDFLTWMERLEPIGKGFEPPLLYFSDLFVASQRTLKEVHLKLRLKDIEGREIDGLWFFPGADKVQKKMTGQRAHIVAEPSRNVYKGQSKLQILIRDLRLVDL